MKIKLISFLASILITGFLLSAILTLPSQAVSESSNNRNSQIDQNETANELTTAEWDSIQAQILAKEYQVYSMDEGGYVSSNPTQGWHIAYGADGTTRITPRSGEDWSWGLTLTRYGYNDEDLDGLLNLPDLMSEEGTLTYQWDENLTEWWINNLTGLEQGFTLQERPISTNRSSLVIEMSVEGNLTPDLVGDAIHFQDASRETVLIYDKLYVMDANGQQIPTHFEVLHPELTIGRSQSAIHIVVEDQYAAYPLTIDPWLQQAKLTASDGASFDLFGFSVAVDGDTAVIGAYGDSIDNKNFQGSAYVFVRSGTTWSQQAKLVASDGALSDYFGWSVAVSGDTAVVGAYQDDGEPPNVNMGSAYVFTRSGLTWSEQAKLTAGEDGHRSDWFGWSVAVDGDTVVIGASQGDGIEADSGCAYVFTRSGTTWGQQDKLIASDGADDDFFGQAVAILGDTVVIGAYGDDGYQGSAYVFTRSGTTWTQQTKLTALPRVANDSFGRSVAISGDTIIIGAPQDDGIETDSGSVYVFAGSGSTWSQQARLIASDGVTGDNFGFAVAVSGDTTVIGAYGADGMETDAGVAYIFTRGGSTWSQQVRLIASDGAQNDSFGRSVGLSGDKAIIGAYADDYGQDIQIGSAYIFDPCNVHSAQSGAWADTATWVEGVIPGSSHGVCILEGITVTLGAPAQSASIHIDRGGVLDLATYNLSAETNVWNFGTMWQTQIVSPSTTVNFMQIQPSGGGADLYRGLDISTDATTDLGVTTVRVMGHTAQCNNALTDGGAYRNRCFMANPVNSGSATVTLYSTTTEDDILADAFFQYVSGTTWVEGNGCPGEVGAGGSCTSTATFASPAYFLIGSEANDPTAVQLQNLSAHSEGTQLFQATAYLIVTVLTFSGILIRKRRKV